MSDWDLGRAFEKADLRGLENNRMSEPACDPWAGPPGGVSLPG